MDEARTFACKSNDVPYTNGQMSSLIRQQFLKRWIFALAFIHNGFWLIFLGHIRGMFPALTPIGGIFARRRDGFVPFTPRINAAASRVGFEARLPLRIVSIPVPVVLPVKV